jgi:hypothetical protein
MKEEQNRSKGKLPNFSKKGKSRRGVVGNPALKHCRAPAAEDGRRIRSRQSQLAPNFIDQLLDWRSLQANASPRGLHSSHLGEMTPTMCIRSKRDWRGLDHIMIQSFWSL